jgi:hypothetical protein
MNNFAYPKCSPEQAISPADQVISDAKKYGKKGDDYTYIFYKRKIVSLNLPSEQYENYIQKLCDALDY